MVKKDTSNKPTTINQNSKKDKDTIDINITQMMVGKQWVKS